MVYPLEDGPQTVLRTSTTHRLATLWHISRSDGVSLRFTDHDKDISYGGNTFVSAAAPLASAREMQASLRANNLELKGAFSSGLITYADLKARRYDSADIIEYTVDWLYPDMVGALRQRHYTIDSTEYTELGWTADVLSIAAALNRKVGRSHEKFCRHELGVGICANGITLESAANKSSLLTVATVTDRRNWTSGAPSPTIAAVRFRQGKIVWVTGNNTGVVGTIKGTDGVSWSWEIWGPTPFDVAVSDTFYAYAGCDKTYARCQYFSNQNNFGGHPYMPGTPEMAPIQV